MSVDRRVRFINRSKFGKEEKRDTRTRGGGCWRGDAVGMVCLRETQKLEGRDKQGHQGSPSILQFPLTTRYP